MAIVFGTRILMNHIANYYRLKFTSQLTFWQRQKQIDPQAELKGMDKKMLEHGETEIALARIIVLTHSFIHSFIHSFTHSR